MTATPFSEPLRAHTPDFFASLRRRIVASLAATVGWICLTLLYVAFWAHGFTIFQSIVLILVSLLVLGAFLVGAWVSFGLRFHDRSWD